MPKNLRLSRADFTRTRHFKRLAGRYFTLVQGSIDARRGGACVVSRKVASRAVDRNRIKRIVREELRRLFPARTFLIAIYVAKKGAREASAQELRADVQHLFAHIK